MLGQVLLWWRLPRHNYFTNQAIEQPAEIACQMHRKRVESAIYLEISSVT